MRAPRILVAALVALAGGAGAAYAGPHAPGHGCGGGGDRSACGQGGHGSGHGNGGCGQGRGHGNRCGGSGGGGGGGTGGAGGTGAAGGAGGARGTGGPGGTGGAGGGAAGGQGVVGVTPADVTAPGFLARPRLHPRRFRAARRGPSIAVRVGTTITYTLSEAARVTFTVQRYRPLSRVCRRRLARTARHRTGPRCRRWISLKGRFATTSAAGPASVRFTGRLRRRALRPGRYRLVIRARDAAGNVTRARRAVFRIVR